jgi:hypothetical protein
MTEALPIIDVGAFLDKRSPPALIISHARTMKLHRCALHKLCECEGRKGRSPQELLSLVCV